MATKVDKKNLLERYDATGDEFGQSALGVSVAGPHLGAAADLSAFLLERIGRRQEAIEAWQAIIDWSEARGYELEIIWPKQELARLQRVASS